MNLKDALRLYVIPDSAIGAPFSLEEQTRLALAGGATAIQLRDKNLTGRQLLSTARAMADLCKSANALFIVNDRLDIALLSGADGVHLGQEDLPAKVVRRLCPPGFIVGVSAQTEEQAEEARTDGADYLGIGAVRLTSTKEAAALGLSGVRRVARAGGLPCVAIGGIDLDNAAETLTETGVDGLSVISAIVGHADIAERAGAFLRILNTKPQA